LLGTQLSDKGYCVCGGSFVEPDAFGGGREVEAADPSNQFLDYSGHVVGGEGKDDVSYLRLRWWVEAFSQGVC
jgi:hypothetical protein